MRFCMLTTFYGAQSFGGDAAYVERLSRALVRRGHSVDVVHCSDAFAAAANGHPLRRFEPIDGVRVHRLHSRVGRLSPLWSHQTGRMGPKAHAVRTLVEGEGLDVVHFHNVSLLGAPEVLEQSAANGAVRLMTAHEYWLVCPMHSLWKLDREVCERPQCVRCTAHGRRPPQLWRSRTRLGDALGGLDALVCPSRHSAEMHAARGVERPLTHLPYFLPDDWAGAAPAPPRRRDRPYLAAAGRLVRWKGFHELIELMDRLPQLDLLLAGTGPREPELRRLAAERPNVELVGLLSPAELAELFRGARAVVVPSLGYETFGYVVLEALSVGTPAIVRRRGALPELIEASGGGLVFDDADEAVAQIERVASDGELHAHLAGAGAAALRGIWSEESHVASYLELVEQLRAER